MPKNFINDGARFGPRPPIAAAMPATARRLVITVDFPSPDQMTVNYSRPTNHIEVALIGAELASESIKQLALAQAQIQNRPDPTKPHSYDVNLDSASSVRGNACGLCGTAKDNAELHPFETPGE